MKKNNKNRIASYLPFQSVMSLKDRLVWYVNLRWIATIGIIIAVPISGRMLNLKIGYGEIINTAMILLGINIICLFIARHFKFKNEIQELIFAEVQIVIDLLLLSIVIHFSGGIGNPFYFLYIVQVIFSGILFPGFVLPYVNAIIATIFLTVWTAIEYFNPAGSYNLRNEQLSLSLIIISLAAFYIINFSGIYIINNFMMNYRALKKTIDEKNALLEKSIKDRNKAFRFAAHELKSPMIAIQSTLEVVKSLYAEELRKEVRNMVFKAEKRSSQVIDMIKEMIAVTQYNLKIEKPVIEEVNFGEWLGHVVKQYNAFAVNKRIELIYNSLKQDICIKLDANGFERVAANLINNALRYTQEGGQVIVTPFFAEEKFGFSVKDSGIGIPKEDLDKIFEEFYRSKNAKEAEQLGTGLGLSLVKEIVQFYGGQIFVNSELGKGSEFIVEIPIIHANYFEDQKTAEEFSLEKMPA
jgi:signal transduction histidine kinase